MDNQNKEGEERGQIFFKGLRNEILRCSPGEELGRTSRKVGYPVLGIVVHKILLLGTFVIETHCNDSCHRRVTMYNDVCVSVCVCTFICVYVKMHCYGNQFTIYMLFHSITL